MNTQTKILKNNRDLINCSMIYRNYPLNGIVVLRYESKLLQITFVSGPNCYVLDVLKLIMKAVLQKENGLLLKSSP
jgi:hypothetical protein